MEKKRDDSSKELPVGPKACGDDNCCVPGRRKIDLQAVRAALKYALFGMRLLNITR